MAAHAIFSGVGLIDRKDPASAVDAQMGYVESVARWLVNTLLSGNIAGSCYFMITLSRNDLAPWLRDLMAPVSGLINGALYGLIMDRVIQLMEDKYHAIYGDVASDVMTIHTLLMTGKAKRCTEEVESAFTFEGLSGPEKAKIFKDIRKIIASLQPTGLKKLNRCLPDRLPVITKVREILRDQSSDMTLVEKRVAILDALQNKTFYADANTPSSSDLMTEVDRIKTYLQQESITRIQQHCLAVTNGLLGMTYMAVAAVPSFPMLATALEAGIAPWISSAFLGLRTLAVALNLPDLFSGQLVTVRYERIRESLAETHPQRKLAGMIASVVIPVFGLLGAAYSFDQHAGISQAIDRTFQVFCGVSPLKKMGLEMMGELALIPFNIAWGVDGAFAFADLLAAVMVKFAPSRCVTQLTGSQFPEGFNFSEIDIVGPLTTLVIAYLSGAPAVATAQSGKNGSSDCTDTRLPFELSPTYKTYGVEVTSYLYGCMMNFKSMMANLTQPTDLWSALLKMVLMLLSELTNKACAVVSAGTRQVATACRGVIGRSTPALVSYIPLAPS